MAIVKTNVESKAKLVYQVEDDGGETKQTSRTFSNFIANATDQQIYDGLSAVVPLLDVTGPTIVRVDEATLVSE